MTTSTLTRPTLSNQVTASPAAAELVGLESEVQPTCFRRILVATDGRADAAGALRVAQLLADRHDGLVDVVTVFEPIFPGGHAGLALDAPVDKLEKLVARVTRQVQEVVGAHAGWSISVRIGPVATTIARCAREHESDLLIVGLGRQGPADRLLGTETTLEVANAATVPMLSVPAALESLPNTMLLGVDFSRACLRAARAALEVLGRPAVVHLAYVHTNYEPFPREPDDPGATYAAGFGAFLNALEEELGRPDGVTFEHAVLRGDAASELLAHASRTGVGLIAVGSHGQSKLERLVFGSVATRIIRAAERPVLVSGLVPPDDRAVLRVEGRRHEETRNADD